MILTPHQAKYLAHELMRRWYSDQTEVHLILAACGNAGQPFDEESARRPLVLPGRLTGEAAATLPPGVGGIADEPRARIRRDISKRNARFFEEETDKLDHWVDDLDLGLEREIKDIDRQIKGARRAASAALTLEEKLDGQKRIKALENHRKERRRLLFDARDEIDERREALIGHIKGRLGAGSKSDKFLTLMGSSN